MRKILASALMLSVMIGLMLPASAGSLEKKNFEKHNMPNIDVDINNAVVTQTQVAVPISIGNMNTAWHGNAGTQSIYQSQYSNIYQSNK
jgi:hypothetical protein